MVEESPQLALFVAQPRLEQVRVMLTAAFAHYELHVLADVAALQAGRPSPHCRAIVADGAAGATNPLALIQICQQVAPGLPLLILSEENDPAVARHCLEAGAADFIHYDWLFRLPYALENAIIRYDERLRQFETDALQRANAMLAKVSRRKDEFLANVSHELRTPLNNVLLAAQMLELGVYGHLNPKQMRAVTNILSGGNHLLNLINDILDLSRIESGHVELAVGQVSLQRLAEMSRTLLQETAMHKGITLLIDVDSTVEYIEGDYQRLLQIVVNLLGNAVKFTPAGRKVGLKIQSDASEERIVLEVWDEGIGIAEAELERLFQPFVRADNQLTQQIEGTGLGLALVAQLVDLHNGSIQVESEPDVGTRFTIALPWPNPDCLLPAEPEMDREEERILSERFREATVLIVDDNSSNREAMADFCGAGGCTVVTAADGLRAIELVRLHRPDIVVMDVRMPVMNGLDAIRHLRADEDPAIAEVPVVIYTALAMPGDEQRCLEAGATAYFSKPINLVQMKKRVMRLVGADLLTA